MTEEKKVTELVSREAFEQAFMEFQEQWRKELRKEIIKDSKVAPFKYIAGLQRAADIVWKLTEDEPEEVNQ